MRYLAVLLLVGCTSPPADQDRVENPLQGLWQQADSPGEVKLVLEQVYGDDEEDQRGLLGASFYAAADSTLNLYVTDIFSDRLVAFAPDGSVLWESGSSGQGPGEFNNADAPFFDGVGRIYLSNQSGTRVDRFGVDGQFLDAHLLEEAIGVNSAFVTGLLDPETLVLSRGVRGIGGVQVVVVSLAGGWAVADSFTVDMTGSLQVPQALRVPTRANVSGEHIGVSALGEYRYEWYDRDGGLRLDVSRGPFDVPAPYIEEIPGGVSMSNYAMLYGPFEMEDGRWLGGGSWPTDLGDVAEYKREAAEGRRRELTILNTVDLYDASGQLLYAFSAEELDAVRFGQPLATGHPGFIYARMTDGPYIGRYRLETP